MTVPELGKERCDTCNGWGPDGHVGKHPFVPAGGQTDPSLFKKQKVAPDVTKGDVTVGQGQWPFDPVLRQALVDKGVLTPQDLTDAEAKIRAVSAVPAVKHDVDYGSDQGGG
jgi:hypothetical protein